MVSLKNSLLSHNLDFGRKPIAFLYDNIEDCFYTETIDFLKFGDYKFTSKVFLYTIF